MKPLAKMFGIFLAAWCVLSFVQSAGGDHEVWLAWDAVPEHTNFAGYRLSWGKEADPQGWTFQTGLLTATEYHVANLSCQQYWFGLQTVGRDGAVTPMIAAATYTGDPSVPRMDGEGRKTCVPLPIPVLRRVDAGGGN